MIAKNDFSNELPDNYVMKTLCCFVVDTSGSMNGASINELNKSLQQFHQEIKSDQFTFNRIEIAIVEFNSNINTIQLPALVNNISIPTLIAKGSTKMVEGVNEAIDLVHDRKTWYKSTGQPYRKSWIILISDGIQDNEQDLSGLATRIETETKNEGFIFLPIGVQCANMDVLNQISGYFPNPLQRNWVQSNAVKFNGIEVYKCIELSIDMRISANVTPSNNANSAYCSMCDFLLKEQDETSAFPDPSDWM